MTLEKLPAVDVAPQLVSPVAVVANSAAVVLVPVVVAAVVANSAAVVVVPVVVVAAAFANSAAVVVPVVVAAAVAVGALDKCSRLGVCSQFYHRADPCAP